MNRQFLNFLGHPHPSNCGIALLVVLVTFAPGGARAAEFVQLGFLGNGDWNESDEISGDGQSVVGRSEGEFGDAWPYRWTRDDGMAWVHEGYSARPRMSLDGSVVTLADSRSDTGRIWSQDHGLISFNDAFPDKPSADGSVVPMRIQTDSFNQSGFAAVWNEVTGVTPIPVPPDYTNSTVDGISGNGEVLFGFNRSDDDTQPFVWSASDGMIEFDEAVQDNHFHRFRNISFDGTILFGTSISTLYPEIERMYSLWRWTRDDGLELLHEATTNKRLAVAKGHEHLSNDGLTFVGTFTDGNVNRTGTVFRWSEDSSFQELPHFPGYSASKAKDITPDGSWILGISDGPIDPESPDSVYWLWNEQAGMLDIFEVLTQQGLGTRVESWESLYVKAISGNARAILGNGHNPEGERDAWVAYLDPLIVPEPSCFALCSVIVVLLTANSFKIDR